MPEKLQLVDADTLLSTPMEKTLFVVDGLIPQGVSMLCGSGKIGKSWLMLWLGIRVAQGLPLRELPTNQSDVLYLCLEDTRGAYKTACISWWTKRRLDFALLRCAAIRPFRTKGVISHTVPVRALIPPISPHI